MMMGRCDHLVDCQQHPMCSCRKKRVLQKTYRQAVGLEQLTTNSWSVALWCLPVQAEHGLPTRTQLLQQSNAADYCVLSLDAWAKLVMIIMKLIGQY